MTIALAGLFNDHIVENIVSFCNPCPEVEWEQVYGFTTIYRTKRLITYGGGPEGGFCSLFREHEPGWYRWGRSWRRGPRQGRSPQAGHDAPPSGPTYEIFLDGQVAIEWIDGMGHIGALPPNWEDYNWEEDDEVRVMTHAEMQIRTKNG